MSIEISSVQRLRVYVESTFGSDATMSINDFVDVPANEGSIQATITTDELDPMQVVQSRFQGREKVLGKRSATLQFAMNLAPTGTAANASTTAVTSALGILLKATMGGENLGIGGTATTGSSATVINLTSGHGARFASGMALGWVNASGVLEIREIESVSSDAVTLKHALSGSPASSDVIYNCATYYFTEDPSTSLQFLLQGREAQDSWLLVGGQAVGGVTIAFDVTGAALPTATFNFTFAGYYEQDEIAAAPTAIGTASFSAYSPIVGQAGELRVFTVGAATLVTSSLVHCSALAFTPKISFVPVPSPSGINTVYRWRAARVNPPVEGSFTPFFEDLTWFQARDAKTDKAIFYRYGVAAGAAVMVSAPTVQILNPQRADAGEIASQTISWAGRIDTDIGSPASSTAIARSPFRIHIF
jgi:hypothetical protein